jgi:hypothetical protein
MYHFQTMAISFTNFNRQKFQNLPLIFLLVICLIIFKLYIHIKWSLIIRRKENSSANMASVEADDITQLFAALSSQMTTQSNSS